MAGRGSDGCGVGVGHSFAELGRVASEECPTGITELGVQLAAYELDQERALEEQGRVSTIHGRPWHEVPIGSTVSVSG